MIVAHYIPKNYLCFSSQTFSIPRHPLAVRRQMSESTRRFFSYVRREAGPRMMRERFHIRGV